MIEVYNYCGSGLNNWKFGFWWKCLSLYWNVWFHHVWLLILGNLRKVCECKAVEKTQNYCALFFGWKIWEAAGYRRGLHLSLMSSHRCLGERFEILKRPHLQFLLCKGRDNWTARLLSCWCGWGLAIGCCIRKADYVPQLISWF